MMTFLKIALSFVPTLTPKVKKAISFIVVIAALLWFAWNLGVQYELKKHLEIQLELKEKELVAVREYQVRIDRVTADMSVQIKQLRQQQVSDIAAVQQAGKNGEAAGAASIEAVRILSERWGR